MKIKCLSNTGAALRVYENKSFKNNELGRFGSTGYTEFGLPIGKEYLVMGIIFGEGTLDYLIDDGGYISAYPYPLFEVIDNKLPSSWFFKSLKNTDANYPYQEAVLGYYELVFDNTHYEKLIDVEENACRIYFRRKIELEEKLKEQCPF
ncbi:MAG: hypothetical protein LBK94_09355 [Prevotellaceae bacterium]|jgi:hypothetical protein|nr:hypothetical protein [Prevotellaceae bacterium]